jgi:hypothetical protein
LNACRRPPADRLRGPRLWKGLIEPYAEWFDSQETFERFRHLDDEARARIQKGAAKVTVERSTGFRRVLSLLPETTEG